MTSKKIKRGLSFLLSSMLVIGTFGIAAHAAQPDSTSAGYGIEGGSAPVLATAQVPGEIQDTQKAPAVVTDVDEIPVFEQVPQLMSAGLTYREVLQPSSGYPESDHNYTNNLDKTYTYQVANAAYLKVTFSDSTETESNYDYLYIYNSEGTLLGKYTGTTLAGQTIQVMGDTVKIKLTSDYSNIRYGFSLSSVYAGFACAYRSIEIATEPNKTLYAVGETIDLTGLTLTATDDQGQKHTLSVSDGIELISGTTASTGRKTVTVGFGDLQTQFEIGVHVVTRGEALQDPSGYPESSHDYANNTDQTWVYTVPGAEYLKLTFSSSTETEEDYDFIYIYDINDSLIEKYDYRQLRNKTVTVTGDTVKIRLTSDGSSTEYGFSLTSIYAYTDIPVHEANNAGVYTPHTCTENAYTTYTCAICSAEWIETHENTAAHTWGEGVYTDPTCTADGYTTVTCTVCGATQKNTNTGSALGHSPDAGVYTAPDCFADGYTTYTCTVCGNISTQQDVGTAFHTFADGACTTCGVSDTVISGGWVNGKSNYWAMLPGDVLYLGGSGEVTTNKNYRSEVLSATSVIIEEGITKLGYSALHGLTKLTSVQFPDTLTTIGGNAFYGCTALRHLYIPSTVTFIQASYSSDAPFYNCALLKVYCQASAKPTGWGPCWNYYNSNTTNTFTTYFGVSRQEFDFWSTLDTSASSIVIPSYISRIPEKRFYGNTYLNTVTFESGVKSIGSNAFYGCSNLQYVYIPDTVTSIGSNAFSSCNSNIAIFCQANAASGGWASGWTSYTPNIGISPSEFIFWSTLNSSVTSVTIPEGVTTIPGYAFRKLSSLQSVFIPSSVTKIQANAFYNRDSLTSLYLGSGVASIGKNAFYDCDGLSQIYIPSGVTSITAGSYSDSPFYGCGSALKIYCGVASKPSGWGSYWNYYGYNTTLSVLYGVAPSEYNFWTSFDATSETVTIPHGITSIPNGVFRNVTAMKKVIIPSTVTSIGSSAFSGCSNLEEVQMGQNVTTIGSSAFSGCSSLKEVQMSQNVTSIASSAFANCSSLSKIDIPEKISVIGSSAFYGCNALSEVYVHDLTAWCAINFDNDTANPLYYGDLYLNGVLTTNLVIPENVTAISRRAFCGANITGVTIHKNVTSIGSDAFYNCSDLEKVHISDLSAWCGIEFKNSYANPLYYGTMHLNGTAVTELVIPEDVTSISTYAFAYPKLTAVTIHPGVTSVGSYAFYSCSQLTAVHIQNLAAWCAISFPDYAANPVFYAKCLYLNGEKITELTIPQGVTSIGSYAFAGCSSLTEVHFPTGLSRIQDRAFYSCSGLTEVSVPQGVTGLSKGVFESCSKLTMVTLPQSLAAIGEDAFRSCSALSQVNLPDQLTTISQYAFRSCSALTEITFPASLGSIGYDAFGSCSGLTDIYFTGDVPSISSSAFNGVTANAYYSLKTSGWNDLTLINYGGKLSWQPHSTAGTAAQGTCTDTISWLLDEDGTLIISGTGALPDYAVSASKTTAPWKNYAASIREVVISDGITYLGKYAFYGSSMLSKVTFLGDCPEFAAYAFYGVTATALYKAGNDSWVPSSLGKYGGTITWTPMGMSDEYLGHSDLSYTSKYWTLDTEGTLTLYNWETNYNYGSTPWYSYRYHIKRAVFAGNMSPDIGRYCFANLPELTDVIVTAYTTSVGENAFYNCTKLKYVDLGEEVYYIGAYAFYQCEALESVFLAPDHYGWSVGEYAFAYCTSLEEISIPSEVILGDYVFYGSNNLHSIYINDNTSGYNFGASTNSFAGVTATVYYPKNTWSSSSTRDDYGGTITWVEADVGTCGIDAKWSYDSERKELTIYGSGRVCGSYFAGSDHPWGGFNREILSIQVLEGITYLPSYTFEYCEAATTIILPESLERIDLNAFNNCASLNNLVLPNGIGFGDGYNTQFIRCNSLTDVYYFGTREEWEQISYSKDVRSSNSKMTLHFLELESTSATCTTPGTQEHYRYDDTSVYDTLYDLNRKPITQLETSPALGHNWSGASCEIPKTCIRCGTTEGDPLGHNWKDGDCDTPKTCDRCGATDEEGMGHNWEDADCDTPKTCDRCGATEGEALGHKFITYTSDSNATCKADGTETAFCDHGCGETDTRTAEGSKLPHTEEIIPSKAATCTETGLTEGKKCSVCGESIKGQELIDKIPHTEGVAVRENEIAATCKAAGSYDEVVKCSVCGEELSRVKKTIAKLAHTEQIIPAVSATCKATGLTEGTKCSVCGESIKGQEIIDKLPHTEGAAVRENEIAASCKAAGSYDEVVYCSACGEELSRETKTIDKLPHTEGAVVRENEIAASCKAPGSYDEVVKCSVCGEELSRAKKTIAKLAHTEQIIPAVAATCKATGLTEGKKCSVCGEIIVPQEVTEKLVHTAGKAVRENEIAATCKEAGSYDEVVKCSVCGEELSRAKKTIAKLAHTEEIIPAVAATCKATGLTEGKKCSVCGEILVAQEVTNKLTHEFSKYIFDGNATCTAYGTETASCNHGCGETDTRIVEGSKLAHTYSNWTYEDAANHKRTCTCGAAERKAHSWNSGVITTQPTENTEGVKTFTCSVCQGTKTEKVEKLPAAEELGVPTITVTNRASDGKPTISWTEVVGATGYEVYRCGTSTGTYVKMYTAAATKLSVTHTGAVVGEDYFYKVRAIKDDKQGEFSTSKGVWCDLKRPTITVTNRASDGKPTISWTEVEGATGYEVYRCGTSTGTYVKMYTAASTKLSVTHTGAVVGEDYFYKVKALYGSNSKCDSALSAYKGVWCDLKQPTITVTNRASDGKPTISWNAVEGASGYKVYRADSSDGTYSLIYTAAETKLSVTHIGAVAGEDYFYKVVATHSNSKCNSAYSAAKGVWCDLKQPTITVTNRASDGKPTISWNAVEGASGYKVYRADSSDGTYSLIYTAAETKLNVTHTGAVAGEDYFYKVVATHSNSKCNSAYSAAKGVWCDLARPTLTVTLNTAGKPYLKWTEAKGADAYKVYRSADGGDWSLIYTAKGDDLDVTHTGAESGVTYDYKVMAVCNVSSKANSAYSLVKTITTK